MFSCLMLTYNRLNHFRHGDCSWLLDESVECFLRQTYADKELIILNDCPQQHISFDHPHVRVVNVPYRFASLGEKVNYAASLAQGTLFCRWDDDDIYLPRRLEVQAELLQTRPYVVVKDHWVELAKRKITWDHTAGFFTAAFTRDAFEAVRGYPKMGVGEDQGFEKRLRAARFELYRHEMSPADSVAVYRWANGADHVSAHGDNGYERVGRMPVRPGHHQITPGWRIEYDRVTSELASRMAADSV